MSTANLQSDIAVIGTGLVGTAFAVALQHQHIDLTLLEKHLPDLTSASTLDKRPITLSYGSALILQTLGVWEALKKTACAVQSVHVSEQGALGCASFHAEDFSVPALGYVLPFSALQQLLYRRAARQSNVSIVSSEEIRTLECNQQGAHIDYVAAHQSKRLTTQLLVAADGTQSTTRKLLNISAKELPATEVAWAIEVGFENEHQGVAYERFTEKGTFALLPVFEKNNCRLIWSMPQEQFKQIQQWSDDQLRRQIESVFKSRLGATTSLARAQAYPLKMLFVEQQVQPGRVLLGNSAHTLYPIAAQGFNLALRDVAALSEVLVEARHADIALGDFAILKNYLKWRNKDQRRTASVTQGIAASFGLQHPSLLKNLRGAGLLTLDMLLPMKRLFGKRMMGLAGHLPKLMCGIKL